MKDLSFNDVLAALTHIKSGIPLERLTSRIRLGEHRSLFFGPSHNLYDIKEFDPECDPPNMIVEVPGGDEDVVYARRCIETHEVKINFLIDLSPSVYAGVDLNKRKLLLEALGFIGVTGVRYGDPVGFTGFTDKIVLNSTPRCGANNFYYLVRIVYDYLRDNDPTKKKIKKDKTDFFAALDFVRRSFDKSCFIPVISDFVGFEKVVDSPLLRMVASKHELIFIFLDDPLELLGAQGFGQIRTEDIESGDQIVVSRRRLSQIEKEIRAERRELRTKLRRMGIDSVVLEYGKQGRHFNRLTRFFLRRHKRLSFRR
ncbi:MAG: hypothetical protein UT29_C0002G0045 [Candidatus Yanofskybacteria bacterium GW2011_GWA1_39_13]|uniref:DUF58 domain-containing protein n=1 Tax=Yanofskybacteria sp. (strain GW2011_GWA1_39_13) TaxID=1619019 RepID=A0A0G0MH25_YANXG|nr:MAG: hypothetical protein UT29_C0002G0045 [Candidatus Yanofskybacteria bacterium GW2011_GWA1_39_13]